VKKNCEPDIHPSQMSNLDAHHRQIRVAAVLSTSAKLHSSEVIHSVTSAAPAQKKHLAIYNIHTAQDCVTRRKEELG
jgi:hypothetical protein